jgi:hypothetical protein
MSYKISWKTYTASLLLSFLIIKIMGRNVINIFDNYFASEVMKYPSNNTIANFYIHIVVLMIPISLFRELIHGAMYLIFGGRVRYGIKFLYFFAQETSGIAVPWHIFILILSAPLILISSLSMILPYDIGRMIYLLNFISSSGDIFMIMILLKYNSGSKIIDRSYGFDVVGNNS